ncbi:hypothetical protein PQQ73_37645 [Paraburkholderia strydomiana]|jgi:hypothetical protein|uniref:Uncharacterized protein n=1 Tax=Paraburkholderia strydomiana TaxID=1245417 RepID=A0ABW9ESP5_9BURK
MQRLTSGAPRYTQYEHCLAHRLAHPLIKDVGTWAVEKNSLVKNQAYMP